MPCYVTNFGLLSLEEALVKLVCRLHHLCSVFSSLFIPHHNIKFVKNAIWAFIAQSNISFSTELLLNVNINW